MYVCGGGTCDTQHVSSHRAAADQAAVDCVCLRERERAFMSMFVQGGWRDCVYGPCACVCV